MATTQNKNIIEVQETRLITYKKKSLFYGMFSWYEQMCATHFANDIIIVIKSPIRKIIIVEEDELGFSKGQKEITL